MPYAPPVVRDTTGSVGLEAAFFFATADVLLHEEVRFAPLTHTWISEERLKSRLIMQVHDELVLEVPDSELDRMKRELPKLMSGVAQLSVPLVVDVGAGPNWDTAH